MKNYVKKYVTNKFNERFPDSDVDSALEEYQSLDRFKISDNVETVGGISEEAHFVMRCVAQYHMEEVFKAMKIDMTDPNVEGEKGTPYRIIKMWTGDDLEDSSELLSGRWANRPRIANFPKEYDMAPITKTVDIVSVCSHHAAPFSTMFRPDSYAVVSYIPDKQVLGISKLQRIVDWVARRGHLQENLTKMIYDEVCAAAGTDSVYVKLYNLVHTCESLRGAQSQDGAFTSEHYGGEFNKSKKRKQVLEN